MPTNVNLNKLKDQLRDAHILGPFRMSYLTFYLLSMEMDRLLERGATVSLFSLVIVGSEAEDEKMEAGGLSFTESGGENRAMNRERNQSHVGGFPISQTNTSHVCFEFKCFI